MQSKCRGQRLKIASKPSVEHKSGTLVPDDASMNRDDIVCSNNAESGKKKVPVHEDAAEVDWSAVLHDVLPIVDPNTVEERRPERP